MKNVNHKPDFQLPLDQQDSKVISGISGSVEKWRKLRIYFMQVNKQISISLDYS